MTTKNEFPTAGRSRLYLQDKGKRFVLRFYPRPHKGVSETRMAKAFEELDQPNAEHALQSILPADFCQEVEDRGFSLVECMKTAQALLRGANEVAETLITDEQLAAILGGLAPGMDPYVVLVSFQRLLRNRGKFAARILRDFNNRFGREGEDRRGYIRMSDPVS